MTNTKHRDIVTPLSVTSRGGLKSPEWVADFAGIQTMTAFAKNAGSARWASLNDQGGKYRISLSYRWLSPDRTPLSGFDSRSPLPYDVQSGETASFSLDVTAPDHPGTYYLEFDMVQELVTWFQEKGSSTSMIKIVVL